MTPHERHKLDRAALELKLFHEMMDKRVVIPKLGSLEAVKEWVNSCPEPVVDNTPTTLPADVEKTLIELQNLIKSLKKPKLDC